MKSLRLLLIVLVALAVGSIAFAGKKKSSDSDSDGTTHVKEYTRKDGTVVHAYDRSSRGSKSSTPTPAPVPPLVPPVTESIPDTKTATITKPEKVAEDSDSALGEPEPESDSAFSGSTGGKKETKKLVGKTVGISDGDTVKVLDANKNVVKIRLAGIDAPESSQAFGQKAKEALAKKIFQKDVKILWQGQDKYGRTIGHIYVDGRWINKELIEEGWAWHYKQYDKNQVLADAETEARTAKRGLWADPHAVPPWEYRHSEKERKAVATK